MKRILALHPSTELYGADRIFASVIQFFGEDDYSVDVVLKNDGKLAAFIASKTGVATFKYRQLPVAIRSVFGVKTLLNFIRDAISFFWFLFKHRKTYDILYINTLSLFVCAPLGRIAGFKKIVTHSHEIISQNGVVSRIIISVSELFSNKIICVSNAVKEDMSSASFFRNEGKYDVVHNGIDDIGLTSKPSNIKANAPVNILLLGRIMPEKGQWFTVDTVKLLDSKVLDKIKIVFAGGAPPFRKYLLDDLIRKIDAAGLNSTIEIVDFCDNPSELIKRSDICLIPSLMKDPFPTTVLESMACSKPVITTNNGGAKEIIDNHKTGILIEPGDSCSFKTALLHLINNPDNIYTYGVNGRNVFLEHLTLDSFKFRLLRSIKG